MVALEDYLEARGVSSLKDAPVKDPLMASVKDPMKFIGYRALYLTVHTWLRNAINASLIPSAPDGHPNSPAYGHLKLPHLN